MHFAKFFIAIIEWNAYWLLLPPALPKEIFGNERKNSFSEMRRRILRSVFRKTFNLTYLAGLKILLWSSIKRFYPWNTLWLFKNRSKKKMFGRVMSRINTSKKRFIYQISPSICKFSLHSLYISYISNRTLPSKFHYHWTCFHRLRFLWKTHRSVYHGNLMDCHPPSQVSLVVDNWFLENLGADPGKSHHLLFLSGSCLHWSRTK